VNIVAGADAPVDVEVLLDGQPLQKSQNGLDVTNSQSHVQDFKLYNLVHAGEYGTHTITINVKGKDLRLYTFTFG